MPASGRDPIEERLNQHEAAPKPPPADALLVGARRLFEGLRRAISGSGEIAGDA